MDVGAGETDFILVIACSKDDTEPIHRAFSQIPMVANNIITQTFLNAPSGIQTWPLSDNLLDGDAQKRLAATT